MRCTYLLIVLGRTASTDYTATSFLFHTPEISIALKYHKMAKNYFFREFECGLSIEQTAELCFKSVRTVKEWTGAKIFLKSAGV